MRHGEFYVGKEFMTATGMWRCTDWGKRVIVAIKIDDPAKNPSWYNGPPYAVDEVVFDENDLPGCIAVVKDPKDIPLMHRFQDWCGRWR